MIHKYLISIGLAVLVFAVTSCDTNLANSVEQTDQAVYKIIDDAWQQDHGTQTNYRIDPAATEPNTTLTAVETDIVRALTLSKAVMIATARNRDYATEKETLYLTALEQTDVEHLYEPIPFAGTTAGYRRDDNNEGVGAFAGAGFTQLLATGAQISTDISLGWVDVLTGDYRSGLSSIATAVISQPLLRGAGRKIALENLTQAQRNTLYQIRTFNRFRKEFVTSIITDYYRLLQLNDRRINTFNYYLGLTEMYTTLSKRATAGKLPLHELEQADQDRMTAMRNYVQAQEDYDNALDAFKVRLALIPTTFVYPNTDELEVLRDSVKKDVSITTSQAIEVALNQRLDLANAADRVIDAERKVDVAADAIRAELDLIGYANPQTDNKTYFGAEPGELARTRDRYELSLNLDLPIDRLTEKNAYRRALITLMRQQRAHQELTDTVILEVQTSHRRMTEARQRYLIERNSVQLAQKRSDNTLLLLQYGRASTRDVLDAREDLLDAENDATKALIEYAIASMEFFRDTEIMKIKPDGMWENSMGSLTYADASHPATKQ